MTRAAIYQSDDLGKMDQRQLAELLVSLGGTTDETGGSSGRMSKPLLIDRILAMQRARRDEDRARREARLWIVALVAGIASALSALAAWTAVLNAVGG
jgi:hypothetical protein